MLRQINNKIQTLQVYSSFYVAQKKQSLKVCKPRGYWWRGMRRHPQAYDFGHSSIFLCLVFLHSLWKNFNTKTFPFFSAVRH